MLAFNPANEAIWAVAAIATAGVLVRPWRSPEALWAAAGAIALVAANLLPWPQALMAVGEGTDVYLFLAGMMLLSELARREGLFDYLASLAVNHAGGSARRLFALVYLIGTVVTVFMSNDATAVVLTPAVFAVAKKAGARPLPYLFICAFVANAASFVLPISNPANLVIFGAQLPPLLPWLARFALPSLLAIVATYAVLRMLHRRELANGIEARVDAAPLSATGRLAGFGVVAVAVALLVASALDVPLGLPTLGASALVAAAILWAKREAPWQVLGGISWSVLLLVAGLFVLVEGLRHSGVLDALTALLRAAAAASVTDTAWGASALVAIVCNVVNNLPAGLVAGAVVNAAHVDTTIQSAVAIGVDLGPNLSVTGSLATLLWLIAIRREGENVSAWQFLRLGAVAMPVALALALAGLFLQPG